MVVVVTVRLRLMITITKAMTSRIAPTIKRGDEDILVYKADYKNQEGWVESRSTVHTQGGPG